MGRAMRKRDPGENVSPRIASRNNLLNRKAGAVIVVEVIDAMFASAVRAPCVALCDCAPHGAFGPWHSTTWRRERLSLYLALLIFFPSSCCFLRIFVSFTHAVSSLARSCLEARADVNRAWESGSKWIRRSEHSSAIADEADCFTPRMHSSRSGDGNSYHALPAWFLPKPPRRAFGCATGKLACSSYPVVSHLIRPRAGIPHVRLFPHVSFNAGCDDPYASAGLGAASRFVVFARDGRFAGGASSPGSKKVPSRHIASMITLRRRATAVTAFL